MMQTPLIEPEIPTVARVTIEGGEMITDLLLEQMYDWGLIILTPPVPSGEGGCSLLVGVDYGRGIKDMEVSLTDE